MGEKGSSSGGWVREMSLLSTFPGFRFCPTDEELISFYLEKKVAGAERSVEVIAEVEMWKYEAWELPAASVIPSDKEWFFFSRRGRKYPNGSQSRRATEMGYWKATGKERSVSVDSAIIGTKRTLVFHVGRAPRGERTQWIMHEYSLLRDHSMVVCRLRKNADFRPPTATATATQDNQLEDDHDITATQTEFEQQHPPPQGNLKDEDEEDDDDDDHFFADILKDDIITLDHHFPPNPQGTANRRINLNLALLSPPPPPTTASTFTLFLIIFSLLLLLLLCLTFFNM